MSRKSHSRYLRLCEDCLLLQAPALITPEHRFTEYAQMKYIINFTHKATLKITQDQFLALRAVGVYLPGAAERST